MDYVCFYHFINCKYNTNIFKLTKDTPNWLIQLSKVLSVCSPHDGLSVFQTTLG